MALGVQRQQQEMEIQRERLAMARQTAAQQAAQFAAGLGEVERQRVVQALSTQAPRAVRAAQQGDVAGFNAIVDPYREVGQEQGFSVLSPQEVEQMGLDPSMRYQRDDETGRVYPITGSGTNVETTVYTGEGEQDRYLYGSDAGLPAGWRLDRETGQASRIPGGPAAAEAEAEAAAEDQREENRRRSGTTVVQDLNRALQLVPQMDGLLVAPGVAGANARLAAAEVGGTIPNRIRQFTESALSNVGLDTLQAMREASPTGGALGQVPIQQQQRLEQVLGSLRLDQEISDLEANLKRVNNIYMDIMYGTAEERAALVESGQLSPEENARIEAVYYDLPFDEFGRPTDEAGGGGLSDEARQFLEME